ncbi:XRE family transcriptional regulator [Dyadobacter fermentans]|uniref:XRE family transcriptional regulator n=1 Tax=Dyadobacter fermentans TaxID=94254 RepID=UPI001CBABDD4|nr:LexA family transcriptional regulator [Dyadobacter fermentans]
MILIVAKHNESSKIFFAQNIKFLRERKRKTQQELADALFMTRAKSNALESGRTAAPQPEDYFKFLDYFRLSIDTLMRIDLSKLGELKLRDLQAGNDVYLAGSNLRIVAITVDKANKENVEYVPVKAKAGYRDGHANPEYIAALPKFSFPNLPSGTFRMFPTSGDSMLPLPEGADVVCRFVEGWNLLKPGTLCIVILKGEQDFVFKKVTIKVEERRIVLESLNQQYKPYEVELKEVLEIWKYHSYQSRSIPEPVADGQHISHTLSEVLKRLSKIEEKAEK